MSSATALALARAATLASFRSIPVVMVTDVRTFRNGLSSPAREKRSENAQRCAETCQHRRVEQATRGWKPDSERGEIGAWFVRAIGERSIEQVAKDMADRGYSHKVDYYRGIMSGAKKPGRLLLAALTEYLGSSPIIGRSTDAELLDALRNQALAINALVKEIRDERALFAQLVKGLLGGEADIARANRGAEEPEIDPTSRPLAGSQR